MMQRAADFVLDIIKAVESPCLQVTYPSCSEVKSKQGYSSQVWRNKLTVRAETSLGAAYGVCRSLIAWRGQVVEWLGCQQPNYENRLLWIEGETVGKIHSNLKIALPHYLAMHSPSISLQERIVMLCQKTIELGFNGLVFGAIFSDTLEEIQLSMQQCLLIDKIIVEFGLRLFLTPLITNTCIDYNILCDAFPGCSGIIYRCIRMENQLPTSTQLERLITQIESVRQAVPSDQELLCYLPYDILTCHYDKHARIWSSLCDALPCNTTLVFSATAADPPSLVAPAHPFWDELRRSADVSGTPLLPLLNIGAIGCGGGLWPLSLANIVENTISQCRRHNFKGVIAVVPAMPKVGGLAHGNLWVMGQRLWGNEASASELMALWFDVYRPDMDYLKVSPLLTEATALALEVMGLTRSVVKSHEQWRAALESSFARLKNLACQIGEQLHRAHESLPTFKDYFSPFYVDMRRLLFQIMLAQQVSLPQTIEESDLSAGFWTQLNAAPGQSVRAGAEVICFERCQVHVLEPDLQRLYRSIYIS